ncbi:NUDIX hydrolase [Catalinimonas sp. 4WD22]|jgi:8-oxo-dGTP pyrophosphatase MutT (NUDIX family)|uniref:NUDIX hydrolase n=1 Tax=Catalinimonas locisalis TaxID=3133978 RepID=UPI0031011178
MKEHINPWKQISSKEIYQNPWIEVHEDQVINPRGGEGIYGKVLFKNLAIGIIPIDNEGNTWLVGQYRYTLNEYSWEIPMGGGSKANDPLESAKRELKEETGLTAKSWTLLMRLHTSNSVTDEEGFTYIARELEEGNPEFDETEDLEIMKLPLTEAVDMVMEGRITDAISVSGLLKAARLLNL